MRNGIITGIANQMMKGPIPCRHPKGSTEEDRVLFLERNRELIEEIYPLLPRTSAAVGAVICKCAIKYGKEKAKALAYALKNGIFEKGQSDPIHLLYEYILLNAKKEKNSSAVYRKAVTACRAYCEDRTVTELRVAKTDIFDWDKNWQYSKPLVNEYV